MIDLSYFVSMTDRSGKEVVKIWYNHRIILWRHQFSLYPSSPDPITSYPHPLILPLFHVEHSPPIVFIIRIILKEDQVDVSRGTYPDQYAYN